MANNTIYGTDASEIVHGTDGGWPEGNDSIWGYGGDDEIYGRGGWDWITGGAGADYIDGGSYWDQAIYADSPVGVTVFLYGSGSSASGYGYGGTAEGDVLVSIENLAGSEYDDVLSGNDEFNELYGRNGNDTLKGGGGYDRLAGDGGDDILMGGGDGDYLHGHAGRDTASYEGSSAGVVVSLITDTAASGDAEGDELDSIENLTGSNHGDTLIGDNGTNVLNGGRGYDTLKGYGGSDTLRGEDGDDIMDGGAGYDTMFGGAGNDTYLVDSLDWLVESGGQGFDVARTSTNFALTPGADIERLETSDPNAATNLLLYGNDSGNEIIGNAGHNYIDGAGGVDQMTGRAGNDTYVVDHASDQVIENGGQGSDGVYAYVSWTVTAGSDVEVVMAASGNSMNLTGNANGNVLRGNNASNTLNGGDGRDELTGFGGQDQFLFNTPLNAATNVDNITDFNVADDTILLNQTIFSSSLGLGNISAGEFVIGTAAQDANDRIIYNSNTGALFYDNDGVGGNAQVQFAELSRGLALTNLDFLVVSGSQAPAFGGGRLPVTRATSMDLAADTATNFSGAASLEHVDLNQSLVHQDYLVY
jgi:Ca2+-binding RTX toxin-like protein